jgi:hypothetical protein
VHHPDVDFDRLHRLRKGLWEQPSPTVRPPPGTHEGTRRLAGRVLPGARYRRRLLWRYTLVWTKPRCGLYAGR